LCGPRRCVAFEAVYILTWKLKRFGRFSFVAWELKILTTIAADQMALTKAVEGELEYPRARHAHPPASLLPDIAEHIPSCDSSPALCAMAACTMAVAVPAWGVRGARPALGGGGRGGAGRVLCPPARGYPRLSSTNNLRLWCEEVGKELGEKLLEEWDDPVLEPWEVTRGTRKRVRWMCSECGWKWDAAVQNRTRGAGCPACIGRVATDTHNLRLTCEESGGRLAHLPGEWNNPTKRMEDFTPSSDKKVRWKCGTCECEWDAMIDHRTRSHHPTGCPGLCNPKRGRDGRP